MEIKRVSYSELEKKQKSACDLLETFCKTNPIAFIKQFGFLDWYRGLLKIRFENAHTDAQRGVILHELRRVNLDKGDSNTPSQAICLYCGLKP